MGVTLSGPDISDDIPPSGFFRLRRDIAYMLSKNLGDLYDSMIDILHSDDDRKKDQWETDINAAINDFLSSHNKTDEKIIDFLFESDCDGSITYGTCKKIINLIDSLNDDRKQEFFHTIYGYAGWGGKACHGYDVYQILKSCTDNRKPLRWD